MATSGSRSTKQRRDWRPYRSPHRLRSHRAAHENGRDEQPPPVLAHDKVPAEPATILHTDRELEELMRVLRDAGRFGYDSEFIGEHTTTPGSV